MRRRAGLLAALLLAAASPGRAGTLELTGSMMQGALVRGTAPPGARLLLDDREVPVAPDGSFVFGFGRDAPAEARLAATFRDGTHEERRLAIAARRYEVQRIDGLPPQTVTPDPVLLERIRREAEEVRALRAVASAETGFAEALIWPATGPISGVYGSQRILNGEKRAPHMGVDVAAPAGSPVRAAAGGVVRLAAALILTGNTVIIDHGLGLTTSYAHLSRLDVAAGQHLRQGEPIGAVGATGRATGPHLHWGLEWFGTRLDPLLAVGPMPAAEPQAGE